MRSVRQAWKWLRCAMFFHDMRIVHELTRNARKLRCDRCGRYFGMNDEFQAVLAWDAEIEQIYCDMLGIQRTNR